MGFLDTLPFIADIRRNHGLEHATVHMLSRRHPFLSVVGRSDWAGFTLYGDLSTSDVESAAQEALDRMRRGEGHLAVHQRCGTMLVTTGLMTALATFLVFKMEERSPRGAITLASIPAAMLAATMAAIIAQPLGLFIQEKYTTSGNPATLEITGVERTDVGNLVVHRVHTTH